MIRGQKSEIRSTFKTQDKDKKRMKAKDLEETGGTALLARIDELNARLQAAEAKLLSAPVTSMSDAERILEEREAWRAVERQEAEDALLRGERQYQIEVEGNPARIVGAAHEGEAVRKYHAYFGIRSTTKTIVFEELSAAGG
jgi:hypothetical protein